MQEIPLDALCHRRWAVPALAELHRGGGGGRFAVLLQRLGANRAALRQALDALVDLGLVARNPGHGHPARPEYVLTRAGRAAAPGCAEVMEVLARRGLVEACLRKWPLPVLHAAGSGAARYGAIRRQLASVTDRALSSTLKDLEAIGLLKRRVVREHPPAVEYVVVATADRLVRSVAALASALGAARRDGA